MNTQAKTSSGLLAAIVALLEILAGALVYVSSLAAEVDVDPLFVWGLRVLAFLCFVLGVAIAFLLVMAEMTGTRSKTVVEWSIGLIVIVLTSAAGVYLGAQLASNRHPHGSATRSFAGRISHALDGLSRQRDIHLRELKRAKTAQDQSAATTELANAFEAERKTLLDLRIPPPDRPAVKRIAKQLLVVAEAYTQLGAAAGDPAGSTERLKQVRRRVGRAEAELERSQLVLARKGYLVTLR